MCMTWKETGEEQAVEVLKTLAKRYGHLNPADKADVLAGITAGFTTSIRKQVQEGLQEANVTKTTATGAIIGDDQVEVAGVSVIGDSFGEYAEAVGTGAQSELVW